jgi:Ni,Fe-hydrogenase I small subunit
MDFIVEGEIQKTVTVNTEAHISITKKEVMRVTGCPADRDWET